jgi:hypothetical protein
MWFWQLDFGKLERGGRLKIKKGNIQNASITL